MWSQGVSSYAKAESRDDLVGRTVPVGEQLRPEVFGPDSVHKRYCWSVPLALQTGSHYRPVSTLHVRVGANFRTVVWQGSCAL